jgi:hypothetical protein
MHTLLFAAIHPEKITFEIIFLSQAKVNIVPYQHRKETKDLM